MSRRPARRSGAPRPRRRLVTVALLVALSGSGPLAALADPLPPPGGAVPSDQAAPTIDVPSAEPLPAQAGPVPGSAATPGASSDTAPTPGAAQPVAVVPGSASSTPPAVQGSPSPAPAAPQEGVPSVRAASPADPAWEPDLTTPRPRLEVAPGAFGMPADPPPWWGGSPDASQGGSPPAQAPVDPAAAAQNPAGPSAAAPGPGADPTDGGGQTGAPASGVEVPVPTRTDVAPQTGAPEGVPSPDGATEVATSALPPGASDEGTEPSGDTGDTTAPDGAGPTGDAPAPPGHGGQESGGAPEPTPDDSVGEDTDGPAPAQGEPGLGKPVGGITYEGEAPAAPTKPKPKAARPRSGRTPRRSGRTAVPPRASRGDAASGSQAGRALQIAADHSGVPYVWGGTSTSGFDCSGYVRYVMRKVGVQLPRTAAQQQRATHAVSDPRPGDLVFFGTPAHHVGIYAGNGKMYDAPRTGKTTGLHRIWSRNVTYGRPY